LNAWAPSSEVNGSGDYAEAALARQWGGGILLASNDPMEQVIVQGRHTSTSLVSLDDPVQALNQILMMPGLRISPTLARAFNQAVSNAFNPQVCQTIGYMVCTNTSESRAAAIANAEGKIAAVSASLLAPIAATELVGLAGTEIFFRTMAASDFADLLATGRLVATGETFISPSLEFASGFEGVTVKFELAGGTTDSLFNIGVRIRGGGLDGGAFGSLNFAESGWGAANALFKLERGSINIGLGQGDALSIFNSNIVRFSVVR
jgi:hypothetical protein